MAEECECEVRCDTCGSWFPYPKAPIHFASWEEYYESDKRKLAVRCPKCGAETELKKENTRFPGKKTGKDSARRGKIDICSKRAASEIMVFFIQLTKRATKEKTV